MRATRWASRLTRILALCAVHVVSAAPDPVTWFTHQAGLGSTAKSQGPQLADG
jgi:hypothetical protein